MQVVNSWFQYQFSRLFVAMQSPELRRVLPMLCIGLIFGAFATDALAQNMPWEGPICTVAKSLAGPTAKAIAVIAVVISGLMLAFMELGALFKTFMSLLMGISMALMAGQWTGFINNSGSGFCT